MNFCENHLFGKLIFETNFLGKLILGKIIKLPLPNEIISSQRKKGLPSDHYGICTCWALTRWFAQLYLGRQVFVYDKSFSLVRLCDTRILNQLPCPCSFRADNKSPKSSKFTKDSTWKMESFDWLKNIVSCWRCHVFR